MTKRPHHHIRNLFLPCLAFSITTGVLTAIFVTAFKMAVEGIIHLSGVLYDAARGNPVHIPLLVLGAAAIGLIASFLLSITQSCRGGGIPTSITAIRGMVKFKWFSSILILPFSSLLTFFCGLPLGTEGPCVQMGTAIGDGVIQCLGSEKHKGWRRYIMTGGASAGFSIAASSPIAAITTMFSAKFDKDTPLSVNMVSISTLLSLATMPLIITLASMIGY